MRFLSSIVFGAGAGGVVSFGVGEVCSGAWVGVGAASGFGGVVFGRVCCGGTEAGTDWVVSVEIGVGIGGFGIISFWAGITGTSFSGFFGAEAGGVGISSD